MLPACALCIFGCLLSECCRAVRSGTHQSAFGLDERSVLAVHLVVQSAGVAQVVAGTIPPPQRGGGGTAVYTFTALCIEFKRGRGEGNLYN